MTENALLEALRKAGQPKLGGEGLRVCEIVTMIQPRIGEERVRQMIRAGIDAGTVRRGRKMIEGLDGRTVSVGTYVLMGKKRK